ncbi:MAG: glycosyltransferase family 4 protein [Candidatus Anstonellales archaeon]
MKIAVLTRYFFPYERGKIIQKGYGAEWRIYQLYKRLSNKHKIKIITQKTLSLKTIKRRLGNLQIIYSPCIAPFHFFTRFFLPFRFFTALQESKNSDIIIAEFHPFHCVGIEAFFLSKILNKPLILDVHDIASNPIYGAYEKCMYLIADFVIATSPEMKSYIKKYNKNVVVVENGADIRYLSKFRCHKKTKHLFLIGFSGSLTPQHGVSYLIEAFYYFLKKMKNSQLLIFGDGRERKKLEILSRKLGIQDKIIFTGFILQRKLYKKLSCCDVLVAPFPSGREFRTNLPLKIIEYLAIGKPCVVTKIPVLKRIAKESRACIVAEPMNPRDISEKIYQIYKMKRRDKMRIEKNAKEYVKRYDWKILAKKLENSLVNFYEDKK